MLAPPSGRAGERVRCRDRAGDEERLRLDAPPAGGFSRVRRENRGTCRSGDPRRRGEGDRGRRSSEGDRGRRSSEGDRGRRSSEGDRGRGSSIRPAWVRAGPLPLPRKLDSEGWGGGGDSAQCSGGPCLAGPHADEEKSSRGGEPIVTGAVATCESSWPRHPWALSPVTTKFPALLTASTSPPERLLTAAARTPSNSDELPHESRQARSLSRTSAGDDGTWTENSRAASTISTCAGDGPCAVAAMCVA